MTSPAHALQLLLSSVDVVVRNLAAAEDLDDAVAALHRGLKEQLSFEHTWVAMLEDAEPPRFYVLSSHGFEASGVGSEAAIDDVAAGPVGIALKRNAPLRMNSVASDARYAAGIANASANAKDSVEGARNIPLPALVRRAALLVVPFSAGADATAGAGATRGAIVAESSSSGVFGAEHEAALSIVGHAWAMRLENADAPAVDASVDAAVAETNSPGSAPSTEPLRVRHYRSDDSVFVDDTYVIRGVAGKLLVRILQNAGAGRREFTNKELRLEVGNKLAWAKDNLESRLILLRRRLDEKQCGIALAKCGRGKLMLALRGPVSIDLLD